ncbi:MAG TPA: type VII secretion-associated protein [Aldersonia sp.]
MAATAVATRVALCVTDAGVWGQVRGGRAVGRGLAVDGAAGVREILRDLGLFGAPVEMECALPSHWGPLRRRAFEDRLREVAGEVAVRPIAVAAAGAHVDGGLPTRHIVVVEVAAQAATATLVGVRPDASRIVGCEHRARVGAGEIVDVVRGLVDVVLGDRMVDAVLVVSDEGMSEVFDGVAGLTTPVHRVDPAALVAVVAGAQRAEPAESVESVDVWPAPVAGGGSRRIRWVVAAAAAGVAAVVGTALIVLPRDRAPEVFVHDRISFELPAQWRVRAGFPDHSGRIELIPDGGTGTRIVLISNPLDDGVGYGEVADALADRIAARGVDGPFSGLTADVVFAGRPGLTYHEVPEPGSVVDWHVTVDRSLQVSIGCQRRADAEPDALSSACEQVVGSLSVTD